MPYNIVGQRELNNVKVLMRMFNFTGEGEPCAYCGVYATEREHVIPKSWIHQMMLNYSGGIPVKIPNEIIVKSCRECNAFASSKVFSSFSKKKEYIKNKVEQKYKKYLRGGLWNDEELAELSGTLLTYIYACNEVKKLVLRRLVYLSNPNPISLKII